MLEAGEEVSTKIVAVIFVLFLLAVLISSAAKCAIAVDAVSSSSVAVQATLTWSHTCSGSDRFLVVSTSSGSSTQLISGATYNGVSMTLIASELQTHCVTATFGLVAPATGANDVVVTIHGAHNITGIATSYTGVDQSTPTEQPDSTGHVWNDDLQIIWTGGDADDLLYAYFATLSSTADPLVPGTDGNEDLLATEHIENCGQRCNAAQYKTAIAGNDTVGYDGDDPNNCCLLAFAMNPSTGVDTCCNILTSPIAFGSVDTGTVDTTIFRIYNCGTDAFAGAIEPSGIAAPYSLLEGVDTSYSLSAGQYDTFHIIFTPTTIGTTYDTMDTGHDSCSALLMSGTGQAVSTNCCSISDTTLHFGSVDTASTDTISFTLTNCGTETLAGTLAVANGLAAPYSLIGNGAYSLAEDAIDTFYVVFAPTSVGSFSDSMSTGNAHCGVSVFMDGTGAAVSGNANWIYMAPSPTGNDATGDGSKTSPYATLEHVCENVHVRDTGDTIVLLVGTEYPDEGIITRLRGHPDSYVVIMGDPDADSMPSLNHHNKVSGSDPDSWVSLTAQPQAYPEDSASYDCAYIKFYGLRFDSCSQAVNISDGGAYYEGEDLNDSRGTPAHHIIFENCTFMYGRNSLKFAGVDTFLIKDCDFSELHKVSVDLVGCHYGTIIDNVFHDSHGFHDVSLPVYGYSGGGGVTAKGGSARITIARNLCYNMDMYAFDTGQATGLLFFRPARDSLDFEDDAVDYEAKDVDLYANIVCGGLAGYVFGSTVRGKVFNNSFYFPVDIDADPREAGENTYGIYVYDHSAAPSYWANHCRDGEIKNNIFLATSAQTSWVNACDELRWRGIAHASVQEDSICTFVADTNLWHYVPDTTLSYPCWAGEVCHPANTSEISHTGNIRGDPLWLLTLGVKQTSADSFALQFGSPAINAGACYSNQIYDWFNGEYIDGTDYNGNSWGGTMDIGAFAGADGDVSVSPDAAVAIAAAVDPAVGQSSMTVIPGAAAAVATAVDPTVEATFNITPDAAVSAATAIDPTVMLASITISPGAAEAAATAVNPTVEGGESPFVPAARYRRRRRL